MNKDKLTINPSNISSSVYISGIYNSLTDFDDLVTNFRVGDKFLIKDNKFMSYCLSNYFKYLKKFKINF